MNIRIQRLFTSLLIGLLAGCTGTEQPPPSTDWVIKRLDNYTVPAPRMGQRPDAITKASVKIPAELRIVSWNVENLFDTENDPNNLGDDEFTPTGAQKWTVSAYEKKLAQLAQLIAEMKPDIIGLAEIENLRVLKDLQRTLLVNHAYDLPEIIHRESPDKRGIDVALLAKYKPTDTQWLRASDDAREMLSASFTIGPASLTVVMCHWKSKRLAPGTTEEASEAMRIKEASTLRTYVRSRLRDNPNAALLVMGDFNDFITAPILCQTAGLLLNQEALKADPTALFNLASTLPENERGTYYYHPQKKWNDLDSISVSPRVLGEGTSSLWTLRSQSYRIVRTPKQLNSDGTPKGFRLFKPKDKLEGFYITTGYSDHFPVTLTLERVGAR